MSGRSVQFRTGYKRGGVTGKGGTTTTAPKKKEPGKIKKFIGKIRKKIIPTFGEQFTKAKESGKKTFKSTRAKDKGEGWFGKKRGKLEYHTRTKAEEAKAEKKYTKRERARAGDTSKQLSDKGAAFKLAKKMGKKEFTHKGKKYHTRLKGEEKDQPAFKVDKKGITFKLPELSGGTAKKIKRAVGAQGGGRIADAARRAQQHGWYSPDMGMRGVDPRMARGRGYAKGGLIKGKPKLAKKGW